eukprot:1194726-Prorocentrum_minimum.AAC.2
MCVCVQGPSVDCRLPGRRTTRRLVTVGYKRCQRQHSSQKPQPQQARPSHEAHSPQPPSATGVPAGMWRLRVHREARPGL